jgi:hypothetical protein
MVNMTASLTGRYVIEGRGCYSTLVPYIIPKIETKINDLRHQNA